MSYRSARRKYAAAHAPLFRPADLGTGLFYAFLFVVIVYAVFHGGFSR
jgi:hypothetical protein